MKKQLFKLSVPMLVALLMISSGCKKNSGEATGDQNNMEVRMTDGPGYFDRCVLDIREIWIYMEGRGWIQIPVMRKGAYNILAFSNGKDTILAATRLSPGKIQKVKLVLGSNNHVAINGVVYMVEREEADDAKLIIDVDEMLDVNGKIILYIDIDAGRSFVYILGKWKFHPFLRCFTHRKTGAIKGDVNPDQAASSAYAVPSFNLNDTFYTYIKEEGEFKICGLHPGAYTLTFMNREGIVVKTEFPVSVNADHETDLGIITIP